MDRSALIEPALDLVWSLWTELGVPGMARRHQRVALDPEPLVVTSPSLFEFDPRLRDQVFAWCSAHAGRLSISRMQGLLRESSQPARTAFVSFSSTLHRQTGVRWPDGGGAEPWPHVPEIDPPRLPMERAALLRLRLRGLCGVGARADVLAELLARPHTWLRASDLSFLGYSKRAVALCLTDLAQAGVASSRIERNAFQYKLARPDLLADLVHARDLAFPPWSAILRFVTLSLGLAALDGRPPGVRRVEASGYREELKALSDVLWLDTPPMVRGNAAAWEEMTSWAASQVGALSAGTSPALGVLALRAAAIEGGGEAWVWLHATAVDHEKLTKILSEPSRCAGGVCRGATVPAAGGWTTFQILFDPRLHGIELRAKIEQLVAPAKVDWRHITPGG